MTGEHFAAVASAFLAGEAALSDLRGAVADSTRDMEDSGSWSAVEMAVLEEVSEEAIRDLVRVTLETLSADQST